jgi:alpha-L-fucosidase
MKQYVFQILLLHLALTVIGQIAHADAPLEPQEGESQWAQQNLLHDGGFESGDLESFSYKVHAGEGDVAISSDRAHSGSQCLQIEGKSASVEVTQTIAVEPDSVYEIRFWIMTEALFGRGVTGLRVYSDQLGLLPYVSPSQSPNNGKWHEFTVYTHTGPATELTICLTYGMGEDKATGTASYDDLSIRRVASSRGAYRLAPDRPLPPGVTLSRDAKPPYNEPFDTTGDYPVDRFEPTLESLRQYECPEWFRDAKFGIYLHWGVYSLAERDCWFPRLMYNEGYEEHEWMKQKFGDVSKFGYKDLVPLWKGEHFDPDRLVKLFKRAGARYVTPVAVHHDNFDLYNSQYHRWNSVEMGPQKDITAMWREAVLRHGLRFGVTTHLAWSYSWWGVNKGQDLQGPQAHVPYDGNDPTNADLYHLPNGERGFYPINPTARWRFEWALRTMDLIDKYRPDLLYFDGAVPFNGVDRARTGMEVIAYYYNRSIQWHGGQLEGVMTIKQGIDGLYDEHVATLDLERTRSSEIRELPWQTDDSIGPWAYKKGATYKSVDVIVDQLVDIVSKNGNLLLNVPPRADGTLDAETEAILEGIGRWIDVNGDAIYETRPWRIAEEGPIRFTQKGNTLYAIILEKPTGTVTIDALSRERESRPIDSIELLGCENQLAWSQLSEHLEIKPPLVMSGENAWVFKIQFTDSN